MDIIEKDGEQLTFCLTYDEARGLITGVGAWNEEEVGCHAPNLPPAVLTAMALEDVVGDEVDEWYYPRAVYEKAAADGVSAQDAFDAMNR